MRTLGEVGAGLRLAHADAEEDFAAADARQDGALLRLAAVAQDQRRALPLGDPVRRDRRAAREQLLDQHEARERVAAAAAVFARQREADPAARAERAAEAGVEAEPRARAHVGGHAGERVVEEAPHLGAERLGRRRQRLQRERLDHVGVALGRVTSGRP